MQMTVDVLNTNVVQSVKWHPETGQSLIFPHQSLLEVNNFTAKTNNRLDINMTYRQLLKAIGPIWRKN